MQFRERHPENHEPGQAAGGAGGGNASQMRQAGESLLQGAEDAISQALSGDSLDFLGKTRQESGE